MNLVGAHLAGYLVRRELGAGAVGTVYLAEQRAANRRVAIKVLRRAHDADDLPVTRWLADARAAAALGHDHIVEILDGGDAFIGDCKVAYLAMELLAGETLAERLRCGPLDEDEARHVGLQLCSALAACHASGIVHRYLTPANVHLCPRGGDPLFVKLTDFGIATLDDAALELDAAADVHALGVLLQEMLTAHRDRATAPRSWSAIVMHCLEDEPRDRFATMDELADAIRDPQAHAIAYAAQRTARAMGIELVAAPDTGATPLATPPVGAVRARPLWSAEVRERRGGHAAAGTPPPFAIAQLGVEAGAPPPTTPLPLELLFPSDRPRARVHDHAHDPAHDPAPTVRPVATPPAPPTPRLPAEPTPRLRAETITGDFPPLRPARPSRAWWLALGAAVLVGGAMIAGALHLHGGHKNACDAPASVIAARGSAEATPAPEDLQSFAITPATASPDEQVPVRVTITSDPPNAHVHGVDGEHTLDGVAPIVFERSRDAAPLTVTLSLPGRASVTRTIAPTHDTEIVIVVPAARSARPPH
ncbi:MAG TPA: serine/threonine-protein kinase [Kofleriaceae bacterium]|nr:serine/threonine-protein kinase [Kofleriaceae bacterium]